MGKRKDMYEIKQTGVAQKYGDATRNSKEGKGRFDLIPEDVLSECFEGYLNISYDRFPKTKAYKCAIEEDYIRAIIFITQSEYRYQYNPSDNVHNTLPAVLEFSNMVKDLAIHFQKGAEMYGERNCEKGIPLWSFRDSGIRHLTQYINGETDEPHHVSAIWNFVMAEWTKIHHPERCEKSQSIKKPNVDESITTASDNISCVDDVKNESISTPSDDNDYDTVLRTINGLTLTHLNRHISKFTDCKKTNEFKTKDGGYFTEIGKTDSDSEEYKKCYLSIKSKFDNDKCTIHIHDHAQPEFINIKIHVHSNEGAIAKLLVSSEINPSINIHDNSILGEFLNDIKDCRAYTDLIGGVIKEKFKNKLI